MLSGHQASRKSSASSLFSSIEPVDLNFDGNIVASPATSCKLLPELEQPTSFNSESVPFPVNVGNNDFMAGGILSSPKALFKVDLLQLGKLESISKEDRQTHEQLPLVTQGIIPVDNELAGEVVLEDHGGGDMMEASYLLRSLCPHDIWICFVLDWPGAHGLQLWVSDLGMDHVSNICTGITSVQGGVRADIGSWSGSTPCQPTQLQWHHLETQELEKDSTDTPKLTTSSCLKGGMGQWITLRMVDEGSQSHLHLVKNNVSTLTVESSALANNGISGQGFGIGALTMQAQPNGEPVRLLVSAKQLERFLKVIPTDIVFPESELSTVLMKEITVFNRSRFEVEFETVVSGVSKVLDKSPEMSKLGRTGTSAALLSAAEEDRSSSLGEPVVSITPAHGRIEGNGLLTAKVVCQPVKSGKQGYTIHLRSSRCMSASQVNVTMAPRKVHRLRLPDVPMGSILDMGYCFINASEGAKVVPLRLENLFAKPLSLAFRSNLTKQVYISLSPTGDSRTDEMQLQGTRSETVYLCLRPGGDASAYKNGRCREVIGGMRISVKSMDTDMSPSHSQAVQDEIMVKFRAVVGQSLLQVSTSLVDLGRLEEVGGFISGFFVVSNPSNQMPLEFSLSAGRASLSVLRGYLIGKETTSSAGSQGKSEIAIDYCLPVTEYGLIEDRIIVKNLSCPGKNAEVLLRVYVDRGSLKSHIQPPLRRFPCISPEMGSLLLNENLPSDDSDNLPLVSRTNFCGANGSLLSNQSAFGTSIKDLEKTLAFEALSPRRTYSLPALSLELEEDRPIFDAGKIVGPLQDNNYLDIGIVYVSLDLGGIAGENDNPTEREVQTSAGYTISDLRSFQSSLILTNLSSEALTLQPLSTLPLQVFVENQGESLISEKAVAVVDTTICTNTSGITIQSTKDSPGSSFEWNSCGNKFSILPGSATRLMVACDGLQPLSSVDISHLEKGQLCAFEGLLAFCKTNATEVTEDFESEVPVLQEPYDFSQFLELLTVKGSLCVSSGEIEMKEINLGKVGDANGWQDLEFDIEVHNSSDAEMVFQLIDAPDVFSFSYQGLEVLAGANGFVACQLPARGTNSIQVVLHTSKLEHRKEARTWSWKLCLVNCNNRKNIMEVSVVAEMTVRNLRFVGLTESTLVLPPLTVPLQPHAMPCSRRFSVSFRCKLMMLSFFSSCKSIVRPGIGRGYGG